MLIAVDRLYTDDPSGAGRVAHDHAQSAVEAGYDVWFVTHTAPQNLRMDAKVIQVDRIRPFDVRHYRGVQAQLRAARPAGFDILWSHSPWLGFAAARSVPFQRRVWTVHSPMAEEASVNYRLGNREASGWKWLKTKAFPRILKASDRHISTQFDALHFLSDYCQMKFPLPRNYSGLSVVSPHWPARQFRPVEAPSLRDQLAIPPEALVLGTLRRLVPRTGVLNLVDAVIRQGLSEGTHLVIAGDGPQRRMIIDRISNSSLESQLHYIGRLPDSDLAGFYSSLDAFLLPTMALECFGLIVLEANACGAPVIATDTGAIPEVAGWSDANRVCGSIHSLIELAQHEVYRKWNWLQRNQLAEETRGVFNDDRWSRAFQVLANQ